MKITLVNGFKFDIESRGLHVITDQPVPTGGNEGMTPVELLGGALGACVGVYAVEYLMRHDLPTAGLTVDVKWEGAQRPNRIGRYLVDLHVPSKLDERHRTVLARTARACTVHNTLENHPETVIEIHEPE